MAYYLDLLILRANARLNKMPFFFAFVGAIPLLDFQPRIPLFLDDEDRAEAGNDDDEEEDDGHQGELFDDEQVGEFGGDNVEEESGDETWFVYPHDVSYEDDEDDEDFVL